MSTTAADRIARPYGIRKADAASLEPIRRFATYGAAMAEAAFLARAQRASWMVTGPVRTVTVAPSGAVIR